MNNNINILWLSDIHLKGQLVNNHNNNSYAEGYDNDQDNQFVKDYFNAFQKAIDNIKDIDLVLITGDLAYNGGYSDYELLKLKLKFLIEKPILTIPGNHDVSWDSFKCDFDESGGSFFTDKNNFLNKNFEKFKNYFKNYFNLIQPFGNNNYFEDQYCYFKNKLFGQVIDKNNKIIFTMINSAWFSVGQSFENWLIQENYKGNTIWDEYEEKDIISILRMSREEGNLITGFNSISTDNVQEFFEVLKNKNYQDYIKISCIHHPLDLLDWSEINEYHGSGTNLFNIISNSDILLTGHVHPAKSNRIEIILNKTLHFRGLQFLDYKGKASNMNSDIGFSIIKMKKNSREVILDSYYLSFTTGDAGNSDDITFIKDKNSHRFNLLDGIHEKILIGENGNNIIQANHATITKDKLFRYIKDKHPDIDKKDNSDINCDTIHTIFIGEKKDSYVVYIYKKEESFIEVDELIDCVRRIYDNANNKINIDKVYFIKFYSDYIDFKFARIFNSPDTKPNSIFLKMKDNKYILKSDLMEKVTNDLQTLTIKLFNTFDNDMNIYKKDFKKLATTGFINIVINSEDYNNFR